MIKVSANVHLQTDCTIRASRVGDVPVLEFKRPGLYQSVAIFAPECGEIEFANALRAAADAIASKSVEIEFPISNSPMESDE